MRRRLPPARCPHCDAPLHATPYGVACGRRTHRKGTYLYIPMEELPAAHRDLSAFARRHHQLLIAPKRPEPRA